MNKPETRITLALKPKVLPQGSGTTKKVQPTGPPEVLPPGIDRAVLDELRQAVRTYDYLRQFGEPIEFWEAVRLARAHRGVIESATGEEMSETDGLADELQVLRRQLSPMVRDLRRFLKHVPDLPPAGEKLEMALGFLLASSRQHEAVAKWLADSDTHLEKAASKLRGLAEVAAPYLEVLRPWSLDGELAKLAKEQAPPAPAAPVMIDTDVLDNLRRSVWCRRLFAEEQLEAAFWELLILNTAERVPTQARQAQIVQSKKDNQLAAFHEEARNLHSRIMPIRARHGRWVEVFQSWMRDTPGTPKDAGEFELAVAFAVIEPDGPARARKWLETPEASAREAAQHLSKLGHKAKAYVAALKKPT